jgi:integrase
MSAPQPSMNKQNQSPLLSKSRGRRSNGEGSVYQRKTDGRWVATLRVNGKRLYFYGATRSEVEKKRRAAIIAQEKGELATEGSARQTVQQYLEDWLAIKKTSVRPATYIVYQRAYRCWIRGFLGEQLLKKVTAQYIQAMYGKLQSHLKPSTIRLIHRVLNVAFSDAVTWGYIGFNPMRRVTPPREQEKHYTFLTPDQAADLMKMASGTRFECFIILAITTGMRRGELMALRWADIDLEAKSLHVRHNVAYMPIEGKFGFLEGEPKTASGKRTIALPSIALEALHRHRARQLEERLQAEAQWVDSDLVFCSRTGNFLTPWTLNQGLQALLAKAKLPPMRLHDLRHSAATILLSIGTPIKVVQEILGHSSVQITLSVYGHVLPGMQREAMNQLDALYQPPKQIDA